MKVQRIYVVDITGITAFDQLEVGFDRIVYHGFNMEVAEKIKAQEEQNHPWRDYEIIVE